MLIFKKQLQLILVLIFTCAVYSAQINPYVSENIEQTISTKHLPLYNKARLSIESEQCKEAVVFVDSLITLYPENTGINYLAGMCFSHNENTKDRSIAPLKKIKPESDKVDNYHYWLGFAYEKNDSTTAAITAYSVFIAEESKNASPNTRLLKDAERRIENLNMSSSMKSFVNLVSVKNIGSPINTEASEYVPLLPSDGSFMIYTYRGKLSKGGKQDLTKNSILSGSKKEESLYFEDVFISNRINDSLWSEPKPIKSINTSLHDAAVTISSDGTLLFIYKNLGKGMGDLYLSRLNGNVWTVPVYQAGLNSDKWDGSATFFPGNKKIIFSSERKGGLGGKDLYTAELLADNKWGNIVNLGKDLNTSYDEDAPFLTADGKTLFFASNGKLSTGGYDILRCDLTENGWSKPYNVGKPINTPNDDKFYIVSGDGKSGYYSSYMQEGKGDQDIYIIKPGILGKPVALVQITGNVTYNEQPVEASISMRSTSNKLIKQQNYLSNSVTGKFLMNLPAGEDFEVTFTYKNLPPLKRSISTAKVDSFIQLNMIADFYSEAYKAMLERKQDSIAKINKLANEGVSLDEFMKTYGDLAIDSLFFKVQIGAYKFIENFNYTKTMNLGKIIRKVYNDGITRFTVGNYRTFNEAYASLKNIRENAVNDAFIIAIYKNNYYYLKDIVKSGFIKK